MTTSHLRSLCSALSLTVLFASSVARAELTPIERATAEALFQEGVQLMDRGEYATACDKFAGTLEIEPGLGTMLHLADCYDKLNRTASSWALFEEVASRAKLAGDAARETIATARANELKARLSLIHLDLTRVRQTAASRSTLQVTIGRTLIPSAMWDSSIPVDPGSQRLEVVAEGYEPWVFSLVVAPGPSLRRVTVPELTRKVTERQLRPSSARPISPALPRTPRSEDPHPSSTPRVLGYISGAIGLVGLGLGGYFGYNAYRSQRDSLDSCRASDPNACTASGVELRQDAFRFAELANYSAIAGGAFVLVGTTLLVVSPTANDPPRIGSAAPAASRFDAAWLSPTVTVQGEW